MIRGFRVIEFNRILNPRLVSPLVRLFAMKIGGSPAPTLAPEVAPSVDVNQQDDVTQFFIRGERLMAFSDARAAVVGQSFWFRLRNPANSGVLLIPEMLFVRLTADSQVLSGSTVTTSDLTTASVGVPRDQRWVTSGGARGAGVPSLETNAAPTSPSGDRYWVGTAGSMIPLASVIPPGAAWDFVVTTPNLEVRYSLRWRERPVQAEELATG